MRCSSKEDNNKIAAPIKITYTREIRSSCQASYRNREQIYSRSLSRSDLLQLTEGNEGLDEFQKKGLFRVLENYVSHMTTKPGKCNLFTYKFQVQADLAIVSYSRPIPFTIRPAVREQTAQMVDNDILEISDSPILNPLTLVHREGKKPRICVDARMVNQFTVPDDERVPPLQDLLQKFEGTRYMSLTDLSSAYLQESSMMNLGNILIFYLTLNCTNLREYLMGSKILCLHLSEPLDELWEGILIIKSCFMWMTFWCIHGLSKNIYVTLTK
jgi:hypothetical protein